MRDSETLNAYFRARGRRMPSRSAMSAWLNCLPEDCWQVIFEAHLRMVRKEGLDRMSEITADSFSVWADSAWPTDSAMILGLLSRAWHVAKKLPEFELPTFSPAKIDLWLERLRTFDRQISFACGKPGSRRKIRRIYRKVYKRAELCLARLNRQLPTLLPAWQDGVESLPLFPRQRATALVERLLGDLDDAAKVIGYSRKRVVEGKSTPMAEKVLSLADPDAAYIKKGAREPVLGYKPQLVRSTEGFITAFELHKGNPADSARLLPLVDQHVANTAVRPRVVSVDDGYSSGPNRQSLLDRHVQVVSMNGAKGRKITPEQDWNSERYKQARDKRSAVESLVYTFRFKFHVHRFARRGLNAVRVEIFEKVVAHNFWRAALLRKRAAAREKPQLSAAA
jgi:IS5 family transposase